MKGLHMNEVKLIDEKTITTKTYEVEIEGSKYIYIDYYDDRGKIIDSVLRFENGDNCDDPLVFEEVQELVDKI
jgi:hypothetical protein